MMLRNWLLVFFCASSLTLSAQKTYHGDGAGDWLRFVPVASVYALKACGVESASSWKRLMVNSALSCALSSGVVWGLKHTIHERRPDWTDNRSFPSGHTSIAFAGATILDKEFRRVSPWISVAGYAAATGLAIDRVARNRHHWQDVVVGAGLGIGGTVFGYWLGDKITGERSRYAVGIGAQGVTAVVYL
jgi:membrane-associated phospholipid phosphatase